MAVATALVAPFGTEQMTDSSWTTTTSRPFPKHSFTLQHPPYLENLNTLYLS